MVLDDETLLAYVDGELDPETVAAVAAALWLDRGAQERVEIFRRTAERVASAWDQPVIETLPLRLVEAARAPARRTAPARIAVSLAVSLGALVIGFGGGLVASNQLGWTIDRPAKEAWLDEQHWADELAQYYGVYAADKQRLAELGPERKSFLERWFGQRLSRTLRIPDFTSRGVAFRGGRLMVAEGRPTALLVYESPDGKPIGLSITSSWTDGDRAPRTLHRSGTNLVYWVGAGYAYLMMGDTDPAVLNRLAHDALLHFGLSTDQKIAM
jgi:anti-sigma factor RsiW